MKQRISPFQFFLILLYIFSFTIYGYLLIIGGPYYLTDLTSRPHHSDYRVLRPAGDFGHAFGIVGTVMMLFMLLYSVKKRTRFFKSLGPLSYWLQVHIYFGIMGPLLIILHSTFKVQGLVAVSFWSMIAVAFSGILGRYIYIQIPKTISGQEIDLDELIKIKKEISLELQQQYTLTDEQINKIDLLADKNRSPEGNILKIFISLLFSDAWRPVRMFRQRKILRKEFNLGKHAARQITKIIRKKELLERRISLWNGIHELFHYWHVFHKPFAIIMYIIMLIHVLIAFYVGYTWIL